MQFSCDSAALLLLRFDQLTTDLSSAFWASFWSVISIAEPIKLAKRSVPHSLSGKPHRTSTGRFHRGGASGSPWKMATAFQSPCYSIQHSLHIVGADACSPGIAVASIRIRAGKSNPPLIQVGDVALRIAHPDQRGSGIRHHAEAFLALAKNGFRLSLSRSLPQQAKNQYQLGHERRDASNDVLPVTLLERGFSI